MRESDAAGAATAQGQTKVQLHLPLRIGNAASQAFTTFAKVDHVAKACDMEGNRIYSIRYY